MIGKQILQSLTVLYCEDSEIVKEQMGSFLNEHFSKVIVAEDGKDGLEKFKQHQNEIDLIISDIVMPNMTGLEMLTEIRKTHHYIPCVMATSIIEPDTFVEAIDLDVTGYVIKPIDYDKLLKTLISIGISITTRRIVQQQEEEIQRYLEAINDVAIVSKTDLNGIITYINNEFCEVSQYTRDELLGANHNIVRHPETSKKTFKGVWELLKAGKGWKGTIKNKAKDGSTYYVKANIFPLFDEQNNIKEYIGIRFLVTEEEKDRISYHKGVIQNIAKGKLIQASLKKEIEQLRVEKERLKHLVLEEDKNKTIPLRQEIIKLQKKILKLEEDNSKKEVYDPHKQK